VTAVFGVAENFAGFVEDALGNRCSRRYGTFFSEKIRFAPLFPRFKRIPVVFAGEANAKTFIDMQADDLHARAARKVITFLPQRSVCGFIVFADAQLNVVDD